MIANNSDLKSSIWSGVTIKIHQKLKLKSAQMHLNVKHAYNEN